MKKAAIVLCLWLALAVSSQAAVLYLAIPGAKGTGPEGPFKEFMAFSVFKVTQNAPTAPTGAASGSGGTIVAERNVDDLSASLFTAYQREPSLRDLRGGIVLDDGKVIELQLTSVSMKTYITKRENREAPVTEELSLTCSGLEQTYK